MYRIELAPGEVTVFRTIEELATGVRNGFITPRARIYHSASQKWLPIEFHPHYKKALESPAAHTIEVTAPRPVERPRAELPSFMRALAAPAKPVAEVSVAMDEPAEPEHAEELPPITVSPVFELPNISYPEITPAEEPVTEDPAGAARSLRPLQLAVAAVVLAAGAYGMMSVFGPSRGDPAPASAPAVADRQTLPKLAPARTPVATPQPATSGFAPALEPRAIVSPPPKLTAAKPSGTVAASVDSSIAPAPVEVDLTVPSLPAAESLVAAPRQRGDSAAIKRILRAVSGGKDVPQRP
jgi:hypothetical protein